MIFRKALLAAVFLCAFPSAHAQKVDDHADTRGAGTIFDGSIALDYNDFAAPGNSADFTLSGTDNVFEYGSWYYRIAGEGQERAFGRR